MSKRQSTLFGIIAIVILVVAVVGLGSLFSGKKGPGGPQGGMPPAEVTITTVAPADVPVTFEYAGRTAGFREVEIRARVSGILLKRTYAEGQLVRAGDVLFVIDPAPFQAALAQAQATYNQAERDWNRSAKLFEQKALSARERDQSLSAYEQAKAQLKTARINLNYTTVIAPITGVTSVEAMSEGSLVMADQSLLTRLTQLDPLYVNFAYPDTESTQQRRDLASGRLTMPDDRRLKAEIHFGDGTVYPQEGDIDFTDSIIDPQTGSVRARAILPNPSASLLPGQFVRVVVKGFVRRNAITIPDQAVIQGPQGAMVYVVDAADKAQVRPVVLGPLNGTVRLVESGLNAGDRVVYEGMIKVRPDSLVKPVEGKPGEPAPAPGAPAAPAAAPAEPASHEEKKEEPTPQAAPAAQPEKLPLPESSPEEQPVSPDVAPGTAPDAVFQKDEGTKDAPTAEPSAGAAGDATGGEAPAVAEPSAGDAPAAFAPDSKTPDTKDHEQGK